MAKMREREVVVDGYTIFVHYQKTDVGRQQLETLQIFGRNNPFLPFNLICKLAKKLLGSENLCLVELFKNDRKIYIWSLFLDKNGESTPSPFADEYESCEYEGLYYSYMQPNQVEFF